VEPLHRRADAAALERRRSFAGKCDAADHVVRNSVSVPWFANNRN
jgi:hypothetical protein